MKLQFLKPSLLVLLSGFTFPLLAQDSTTTMMTNSMDTHMQMQPDKFSTKDFRTWSIGIYGGMLSSGTIFRGKTNDYNTSSEDFGFGGYIKKQLSHSFALQADFLAGNVTGLRASVLQGTPQYEDSKFKSHIKWSAAVTANVTVATFNFNNSDAFIAPYVKMGGGYMQSDAVTTNIGPGTGYNNTWFLPVGGGLKIGLSKGLNIDLGYDVDFVKSATFDGVNTGRNDNFSFTHAGLEFVLGKKSKPQLANYNVVAALRQENAEQTAELRAAMLKAEQDAQAMKDQYAKDQAQLAKDMADDDNDGVANKFDKCPGTPKDSTVDGAGCPFVVKPQIIKETKVIITEEDRRVVNEAIKNLEFDLGKATIKETSDSSLNKVAALLIQKNFSLKLSGHTDNIGSVSSNLRLSKDRAEAVKAYLVAQGANPSRIEATGYGPNQPIATNKTAEGRQKNRRVEFTIY